MGILHPNIVKMGSKWRIILKIHLYQIFELFLGIPIALAFWPAALCVWAGTRIVRNVLEFYLNFSIGGKFERKEYFLAEACDSVCGEKKLNSINPLIIGYSVVQGDFDVHKCYQKGLQMVEGNEKLRWRFGTKMGFNCWETLSTREEFDIRSHVRLIATQNEVVDEDMLLDVLEGLAVLPFKEGIPQWECLLIPSFRCKGERETDPIRHYVQVIRIHHAYGDAVSFCLAANKSLFDSPAKVLLDPRKSTVPAPIRLLQNLQVLLLGPFYLLRNILYFRLSSSQFRVDNHTTNKFLARSSTSVSLLELEDIKSKSGASLTAIFFSSISAALRKSQEKIFPDTVIPRTLTAANITAMLPYPDEGLCNRLSVSPFFAPYKELDARKRLEKTIEASYNEALGPDPLFCFLVVKLIGELPLILQNLLLDIISGPPVLLSNIPAILDTVRICNGSVVDCGAWLPLETCTGVGVATYAYRSEVRFCGIADPRIFPEKQLLQEFLDEIVKQVQELKEVYRAIPGDMPVEDESEGNQKETNKKSEGKNLQYFTDNYLVKAATDNYLVKAAQDSYLVKSATDNYLVKTAQKYLRPARA